MQNEQRLTHMGIICPLESFQHFIFFFKVGQCLLISDVGSAPDGESYTEKSPTQDSSPLSSPSPFYLSFPPSILNYALMILEVAKVG